MMLICVLLVDAGPVHAASVHVGGSRNATRIIFILNEREAIAPEVSVQKQTLIVNFPHTVADPHTLQDQFMIHGLTFDGTKATIDIKVPFTYQVSTRQSPPSVVIDITTKKDQMPLCPIKRIDVIPGKAQMSVSMQIEPGMLPEIRTLKTGRIYIHFPTDFPCNSIENLLTPVPQLKFMNTMKMASGTVLTLTVAEPYLAHENQDG